LPSFVFDDFDNFIDCCCLAFILCYEGSLKFELEGSVAKVQLKCKYLIFNNKIGRPVKDQTWECLWK
jgi:hypothetical protein